MALREELRSSGNWLFRRRGHLPLLLFAVVIPLMTQSRLGAEGRTAELSWEAVCVLIALLGQAIRVLTVGFVPAGTSGGNVTGQRADHLNTTGMYSVVRHPLYLGNLLMWLGVALLPQNGWFILTVVLAFWLYYERIMFAEEEFLRERFGAEYEQWATRTPAFLPRLSRWRRPAVGFCLRAVLRREYSSVFALVSSFAALDLVDHYGTTRKLFLDPIWAAAFAAAATGYCVLKVLKHRGLLQVDGR